ncbi:MAG: T9SS type A sorting domain-containing protein, partial [Oscillospiraceae bacterium]
VVLYPNPAEDKIKISGLPQRAQISILNLNGQVVKQINDGVSDEYMDILGISVIKSVIPVRPGRNLSIIIETAALTNRQKKMGYNAAKELLERLGIEE